MRMSASFSDEDRETWDYKTSVLVCPVCRFDYHHLEPPYVISGKDSYKACPPFRGHLTVIPVHGECGAIWELCFGEHKGKTACFIRVI
jgi:hypothetical protein